MCLPQTRLQKSVPLATKMSSICQTILYLVSFMTYLFDSMFLHSRLQLSSLFKLIPKRPCSGEKNPCPFWRMSGSLWLDEFDLFIYSRMLHSQILSEHIVRRLLQPSCVGSPVHAVQVSGQHRGQQTRRKTWVTLDTCRNPIMLLLLQGVILAHEVV